MQRVAIIGAGFIGGAHALACYNSVLIELVAICDVRADSAKELAQKYGCSHYSDAEAMLAEIGDGIDIVDVCVPTFLHKQNVLLAAKHGKHIVCEKPVTMKLEDMDEILNAVKEAGVKFMAAQVLRFWPEYVEIKRMYDDYEFGGIKMVYANRLAEHPNWTDWHRDPEKSGGALFDLHYHDIDAVAWMFGPVERVYAVGWQSQTGCHNHVVSSLTFKNGVKAVVEGAIEMSEGYPFTMNMRVVGGLKTADFAMSAGYNIEDLASSCRDLIVYAEGAYPVKTYVEVSEDAYQTQLDYFAKCVGNNEPLTVITPEETREVLKIVLAIKESLETGRVVVM